MRLVLDASVAISWCFQDERAALAQTIAQLLLDGATAVVPTLWWFEIRNGLLMGERRGRADAQQIASFLSDLSLQRVDLDSLPNSEVVFALARGHRLTFYDAAYLELAMREKIPLATLDRSLAQAAAAVGVALIDGS